MCELNVVALNMAVDDNRLILTYIALVGSFDNVFEAILSTETSLKRMKLD